jgi:Peptidase A4 family
MTKNDALRFDLRPTNLEGAYSFVPPPEGFDPLTADARTLREHGVLLRRPNPSREPKLYEAWARIVGKLWRPSTFDIPANFVRRPSKARISWPQIGGGGVAHENTTWAGCQVPGRWVGVFSTWRIPSVSIPPNLDWSVDPQMLRNSSWVGLGGVGVGNIAILQAGVDHVIDATGKISYLAWVEWYPNNSWYFGLPVSAGDEIAIAVQLVSTDPANIANPAPSPGPYNYGGINYVNVATGKGQALYLSAPTTAQPGEALGMPFAEVQVSAEWILESMTSFLPKFTPITFDICGACNVGGTLVGQPQNGEILNLLFQNVPQTSTTVTPTQVIITDLQA